MRRTNVVLTLAAAALIGVWLWLAESQGWVRIPFVSPNDREETLASAQRRILYYRDPMGGPDTSLVPKKDSMGMDYIPVYADEVSSQPAAPKSTPVGDTAGRRILYFRNPMGLADTSPVPRKDSMGMDYIPVYADEVEQPGTVRISLDKVQRLGVRTAIVTRQSLSQSVVLTGTLTADERRQSVVSLKFKAWVAKLHVAATGETVRAGQPLFEVHSPFILQQEATLAIALKAKDASQELGGVYARTNARSEALARRRLRLYEVPEREIARLIRTGEPSGDFTWYAPHNGTVLEKPVVSGMYAEEGATLYRLADLSNIWVIGEAPEMALAIAKPGATARISLNAFPGKTFEGKVTFIYPEVTMATRTAKVRIELPNPDRLLLPGMFASVEVAAPPGEAVLTIPDSALIDSGARQVVLVARGEGLFEPRAVVAGRRANGTVEIVSGLKEGETVVSSATFLIDAESNLRTALQAFTAGTGTNKAPTQ